MNPSEEAWVRRVKELVHTRTNFRRAAIEGTYRFMGESPTEVLLFSIGEPALTNPAYFVRELTRVFGNGAIPIYDSVIQVAEDRDWLSDMLPQESKGESIAEGTDPASIGELPGRPSTYLHDHRIPDDFSEEDMH